MAGVDPILPTGGPVPRIVALRAIAQAHDRLRCDDFLVVRRLYRVLDSGVPELIATSTRVGVTTLPGADERLELPGLLFLSEQRRLSALIRDGLLAEFVGLDDVSMRTVVGDNLHCIWHGSRSRSDPWDRSPGWFLQVGGNGASNWRPPLGEGPYVSSSPPGWFFNSFSDLAATFLRLPPGTLALHSSWPVVFVSLADQRGRISSIERTETGLTISIEPPGDHWLAVECRDLDDTIQKHIVRARDGCGALELTRTPSALRLDLYLPTDERVDQFEERNDFSSWGTSVLIRRTRERAPASVLEAISRGETERIEFKHSKQLRFAAGSTGWDILKTVVAFANADGGSLYLGITDEGEIVGCEPTMQKNRRCAQLLASAPEKARGEFERWMREELRQHIHPVPVIDSTWHETNVGFVLELAVRRGDEMPYELLDTHEFVVRTAGTNRHMNREQMQMRFRRNDEHDSGR